MIDQADNDQTVSTNWIKLVKRISLIVGIGFLVTVLIAAFKLESFDPKLFLSFYPGYLLLAFVFGIFPIYLHAYTLKIWGKCFKKEFFYKDSVNVAATSLLGSAVTPTMLGGGPFKFGLLMMHGFRAGQAAAVVTIGSIQDAIALFVLAVSSIYLSKSVDFGMVKQRLGSMDVEPVTYLILAVSLIILVVIARYVLNKTRFGQRVIYLITKALDDFNASWKLIITTGKGYFLFTTLITLVRWIFIFMILMILVAGLNLPGIDYKEIWSLQWIVYTGMTLTPLPGGAGGAEAAFYLVYKSFFPTDLMLVLLLAWRFFSAYFKLIFAALLVVFFSRHQSISKPSQ